MTYWAERKKKLDAQMEKDEERLKRRLSALYDSEARKLEREIAAYYALYGENSVLEYRKLLGSLSEADRRLLMERMEEFGAKYPQWAHLLPVRESIYKLNELEGLQTSILMQQLEIGAVEVEELQRHLEKQAARYANAAAEQMGFGSDFYAVDSSIVKATVGAAWVSEKDFSERIWGNRERLASYLNDDFAKMLAMGASYEQCIKKLKERFENVSRRDMYRLVYTEGTFVANEAHARVHERDFEFYALSCADSRACDICKQVQETQKAKPVPFSERRPGVNFPPLHSWCRCSYTVEVDDWDAWIEGYVARHGSDPPESAMG